MVTVRGSGVPLGVIPEVQKAGTRSTIVCHTKWNSMPKLEQPARSGRAREYTW